MPLVIPSSSLRGTVSYDWEYQCGVRTFLKCVEVLLHGVSLGATCPALLICAAVAVSYINKVEDYVDDHGGRLVITETVEVQNDDRYVIIDYTTVTKDYGEFDASGPKWAAGWTLFVSCACLIFHLVLMAILMECQGFDSEKHNTSYSVTTVILTCLLGLSCLAGGIANLVYYSDTNKLWSDACSHSDYDIINGPQVCRHLLTVRNTEIACAVISFVVTQVCILVAVIVTWSGILINRKRGQESTAAEAPQPTALPTTSQPACIKTEAPSKKPASVPPHPSHCDSPVPPPYEANARDEPPSYQSVLSNS